MTIDEINRATAEAKSRAEALAKTYIDRGKRKGATEGERMLGEAATLQLEIAEKRADLLDAEEAKRDIEELTAWSDEQTVNLEKLCEQELAAGRGDFSTGPVKETQDRMLAELDSRQEQMARKLARHALDAWLRACDELSTFDRPVGQLTSGTDARH